MGHIFIISVSFGFSLNSKGDAPFHHKIYNYSCADWDGLSDHLRDLPQEVFFKLGAPAAVTGFCEWVKVGIDVYIAYRKCQVKLHLSQWFTAVFAVVKALRNHFLDLPGGSRKGPMK